MPKKVKIGIIVSILLVVGFAGYAIYKKGNVKTSFVKEINRNLSPADRNIFEDRAADAQKKIDAAKTDDEKFGWYMQLGYNLQALGSLNAAQNAFESAVKLKPNDDTGYAGLYQTQVDRGDYEGALASIKIAVDKNPQIPQYWKNYVLLEKEHFNASNDTLSALYSEAVVKTANNIDIITTYAQWLESTGNLGAAKEYWQKAIVLYPANKKLYQTKIDKINLQLKQ
jgi:tetratricopeptide (TPR) repeat protein